MPADRQNGLLRDILDLQPALVDRFRLDGEVAVVTGAGKGIGRAIAIALAVRIRSLTSW